MQGQMRLEGQDARLDAGGGQPRHPSAGQCAQAWGAAAATGVGRRLSAAWCGPCPSHALPAEVSVCSHAFQRSHDGHNASSVHA